MAAFEGSTQASYWLFGEDGVDRRLERLVRNTHARLRKAADSTTRGSDRGAAEGGVAVAPVAKRRRPEDGAAAPSDARDAAIDSAATPAETKELIRQAVLECIELCIAARMPRRVIATSCVYMKRALLFAPLVDYDLHDFTLTCVFLAIKTESCPYTEVQPLHERLYETAKVPVTRVVRSEVDLMLSLRFHLQVHHPHTATRALALQVRQALEGRAEAEAQWVGLSTNCSRWLLASLASECTFCCHPAHTGMAVLLLAAGATLQLDPSPALVDCNPAPFRSCLVPSATPSPGGVGVVAPAVRMAVEQVANQRLSLPSEAPSAAIAGVAAACRLLCAEAALPSVAAGRERAGALAAKVSRGVEALGPLCLRGAGGLQRRQDALADLEEARRSEKAAIRAGGASGMDARTTAAWQTAAAGE